MCTKLITFYSVLACLLNTLSSNSQVIQDSISYSELRNNLLSYNGKIAVINKINKFDSKQDSTYVFNNNGNLAFSQRTQYRYETLKSNTLIGYSLIKQQLEILDSTLLKKQVISNVSEPKIIGEHELIFYLDSKSNSYKLIQLIQGKLKEVWSCSKDLVYFTSISDNKQILLIQYNDFNSGVELINLKTLHKVINTNIKHPIKHAMWDLKYPIVFLSPESLEKSNFPYLTFVNYYTNFTKKQPLNSKISYSIPEAISEHSFKIIQSYTLGDKPYDVKKLEIWSTNNRYLSRVMSSFKIQKNFTKGHIIFDYKDKIVYQPKKLNNYESIPLKENKLLIYDSNQYLDYSLKWIARPRDISLYDIKSDNLALITKAQEDPFNTTSLSPKGNYFIYIKKSKMYFYNINSKSIENTFDLKEDKLRLKVFVDRLRYWSKNERYFYFVSNSNIMQYDTQQKKFEVVLNSNNNGNFRYKILNTLSKKPYNISGETHSNTILNNSNLLIEKLNTTNNTLSLLLIKNSNNIKLITTTKDHISDIKYSNDFRTITYSLENFNKPKSVFIYQDGKTKPILENTMSKNLYAWKKQKIVYYNDTLENNLKGTLYYPKNFNPEKKYPLVTYIYEIQNHLSNRFTYPTYLNSDGFNKDLYLENDYFVFIPDILNTEQGSGLSALNCVEQSIKTVLKEEKSIHKNKLGLIGYSFGGYATNFIISQTDLFQAAVSGAGPTDIISYYFSYNEGYISPNYFMFENGQFNMPKTFIQDKELYLLNSPILYADQIKTPLLTYTGKEDKVVDWKQQQEFFTALLSYKKPHISLVYNNEVHEFRQKDNQIDITKRILNWFDFYLKGSDTDETYWIKYNTTFDNERMIN